MRGETLPSFPWRGHVYVVGHVMLDEEKVLIPDVGDVRAITGQQVVHADDFVAEAQEMIA
jgi:hypothetical protein